MSGACLIIGGSGFVGGRLVQAALAGGIPTAYTYAHDPGVLTASGYHVDLTDPHDRLLDVCLAEVQPQSIIYAAIPALDSDEAAHYAVSVTGVERVIGALQALNPNALLIYLSTNAVFGSEGPHREDDRPDPEKRQDTYRAYAITRALGEQVVRNRWANRFIVRTSNVDGRRADGQLSRRLASMRDQLVQGKNLRLFSDRIISPTLVDNLADGIMELMTSPPDYRGVLHIAGSQPVSYYEHARCFAEACGLDADLIQPESIAHSPLRHDARNIALDVTFTQTQLRTRLLDVRDQFAALQG